MEHYDIFISYKRKDKETVFKLKDYIEKNVGVHCWIDLDGIESDAQFANVIIKAINDANVFMFMYSHAHGEIEDYNTDWTVREVNFAQTKKKRIVFVNIDGAALTDWFVLMFGTKQQIDASSTIAMQKLCKDVKKWLKVEDGNDIEGKKEEAILESDKLQAEERDSLRSSISPIDKKYKEYGYTIVGEGKLIISEEDVNTIKDDLSFVKISESVIKIENKAFNYSHSQLIVIPKTVRSIGEDAFNYVHNIEYHGTAPGMPWGALHMNVFIDGDFIYADESKKEITGYLGEASSVKIPRNVETIGTLSFFYCHYIKSVVIPNSVTRIGESAFDGCENLEYVKYPDSLKYIDWAAFRLCKKLKSVVIPKSIITIGECAFYGCDNLKAVYLGNPNAIYSKEDFPSFPEHAQITNIS